MIVDFTNVPTGTQVIPENIAPDEPFGGGVPGVDFEPANPDTTGQVMRFRVVPATAPDPSTRPDQLGLRRSPHSGRHQHAPGVAQRGGLGDGVHRTDEDGNIFLDCESEEPFGPVEADLGTSTPTAPATRSAGTSRPRRTRRWSDRGVGDLQLHRRRAPDPHPRDNLRGRRPRADRRRTAAPGGWRRIARTR